MRSTLLVPALLLTGCGDFQKLLSLKDTFDEYTNGTVASASLVGVEPPTDERIALALEGTDLGSGAQASVWLVHTTGGEMDDGMGGQAVTMIVDGRGVGLVEQSGGEYGATADDGLAYVALSEAVVDIDGEAGARSLAMEVPAAPDFDLPESHEAKAPLSIDLGGQDFDASLGMVMDLVHGGTTWQDRPEGAVELYNFARADGAVDVVTIPADAFPEESVYAVGVAGTWNAGTDTFDNINKALSSGFAGRFRFVTVCTFTDPALCDGEPEEAPE